MAVTVVNSPMSIKVTAGGKTLVDVTGISFGTQNFTQVTSVNETPDNLVINLAANVAVTVTKVQSGVRFNGKVASAQSVRITMKDQNDHFYGISGQNMFGSMNPDLRGHTVPCEVMAVNESGRWAQAWSSFYYSSLGYGSFFDSFATGSYTFGTGGQTVITHSTGNLDWYLFYGPTGDKVHQAYFKIIGAPKKIPMWACGPAIWNDNFNGSNAALGYITNSNTNKIPVTVLWVDRPYSDGVNGWSEMNFSSSFANPGTWIKQINDNKVKFLTWVCPCTFGGTSPPGTFTQDRYYLDLSNPGSVSWYEGKLRTLQHVYGVQGHKLDRAEEVFPTGAAWFDKTPTEEKRGKYLFLNNKVTDESLRDKWGDDQFTVARAVYSRAQPYVSAVWGGDSFEPWEGLVDNIGNGIRTSYLGFPMYGSDIGGYHSRGKLPDEQHLRWLEFGVFSGFMEHMWNGKEPWQYDAAFIAKFKALYDLRMEMLPYIYTLANTSADMGTLMMPMTYRYPDDAATYSLWDQYFFGPAMLVAPIYGAGTSRSVYLPEGKWVNFWNWSDIKNGKTTITANAAIESIPVFIKANSIYPTGQIYSGNSFNWIANYDSKRYVTINAIPGEAGQNDVFTYLDYLDNNAKKSMTVNALANNAVVVKSPSLTVGGTIRVRLEAAPTQVNFNGAPVANPAYNAATKTLEVPFTAGQPITLEINGKDLVVPVMEGELQPKKLAVRPSQKSVEVLIPLMKGQLKISLVDMNGKRAWQKQVTPSPYTATSLRINVKSGAYTVIMEKNGVVLDRQNIVVN